MDLTREYQPSRYPDAVGSGTPRENYSASRAELAIETVVAVRSAVEAAWGALVAAAANADRDDGGDAARGREQRP